MLKQGFYFENHLTNLAARWRKKMEKIKTMDSIMTTKGSLYIAQFINKTYRVSK